MSASFGLDIAGMTDTGRVRSHNEDSIGWDLTRNLAVLADGMGGHCAGDVASKMAVDGVLREYRSVGSDSVDDKAAIARLLDHINDDIYRSAQADSDCSRMGTTLVMACLNGDHITVAHAGDSRVYRFRHGQIEQLTEDHSLVRQLIEQGTMTKEDAENSRYSNVITRALGVRVGCEIEINQYQVDIDDVYLLCSDGLSNKVSDESMRLLLDDSNGDWAQTGQALVDQANQAGGEDNISVVLAVVTTTL